MAIDLTHILPMSGLPDEVADADVAGWVASSQQGDEEAFGRLVVLYQHRVFRLAGRFFRRREDVEEAAQESFLTAWNRLSTYRADAPFEHWLTRVCLNQCYQILRRKKPVTVELDEALDSETTAADPGAALELERLLATLEPTDRFVLLLLDGEGWSVAEIADRVGWSRANVKVRAFRARRKLRKLLENER